MKIKLTVTSAPSSNAIVGKVLYLENGQSIGRSSDNTITLSDDSRVISSRHAQVTIQGADCTLTDHSTNGTFINDNEQALGNGRSVLINTDDLISIGEYQFKVETIRAQSLPDGLESVNFLDATPSLESPAETTATQLPTAGSGSESDLDRWLEPSVGVSQTDEPWGSINDVCAPDTDPLANLIDPVSTDPLASLNNDTGKLFSNTGSDSRIPQEEGNWWQSEPDNAQAHQMAMPNIGIASPDPDLTTPTAATIPQPTEIPSQKILATEADSANLAELLGLEGLNSERQAQLPESLTTVVHTTAKNLVNLLQSRASIKNELRTSRTIIQSKENNPLKFSAGADDALKAMFTNDSDAFLSPERAVEQSFEDISDHQIAVLFAMKSAFDEMLRQFKPSELESKFTSQSKGGVLSGFKTKNWDRYCDYYAKLQSDPETSYSELFGDSFAEAYEAKLVELKTSRSLNR